MLSHRGGADRGVTGAGLFVCASRVQILRMTIVHMDRAA
jgi:hypothetical protein